ncbi:hypothetical protein C8Q79DRAFT_1008451 [Trametes meyenii]|nr:hypothetical protein C8Q79DRAFT_1008451 [Trametes meyenii]
MVDRISAFNARLMHEINLANKRGHSDAIHAVLERTFWQSMDAALPQMSRLLVEASTAVAGLNSLEHHLATVHALCIQESSAAANAQNGLLSRLWTIFGGRNELRQRSTVQVQEGRSVVTGVVSAVAYTMTAVDADLTMLRESVSSSDARTMALPLEVHVKTLGRGFYRLAGKLSRSQLTAEEPHEIRVPAFS